MFRKQNYNKSRVHATRGVRHLRITLGDCTDENAPPTVIFDAEISPAMSIGDDQWNVSECGDVSDDTNMRLHSVNCRLYSSQRTTRF